MFCRAFLCLHKRPHYDVKSFGDDCDDDTSITSIVFFTVASLLLFLFEKVIFNSSMKLLLTQFAYAYGFVLSS